MKKSFLKSTVKLKVINDGSSIHKWEHPWKGWVPLTTKDISLHPLWDNNLKKEKNQSQLTSIQKYMKTFKSPFTKENK